MQLSISPKRMRLILLLFVAGLVLANALGRVLIYFKSGGTYWGGWRYLDFDRESNIPNWYSGSVFLICALLLFLIAATQKKQGSRYVLHWRILGGIFVLLSLDDISSLHERTIEPLRHALHAGSFLHFTWVVPAVILLAIFALAYVRFLLHLAPRSRNLLILAGAVYVAGAIGFESAFGQFEDAPGLGTVVYAIGANAEQIIQYFGQVLFIYALLDYLSVNAKAISLVIGEPEPVITPEAAETRRRTSASPGQAPRPGAFQPEATALSVEAKVKMDL